MDMDLKYKILFDFNPVGVVLLNMEGLFVDANHNFIRMIGYSIDELRKFSFLDVTPKEIREINLKNFNQLVKSGRIDPYEKSCISKNGLTIPVKVTPILASAELLIVVMVEDLRPQKYHEEEHARLLNNAHLASLGEMASGVAHEINNPLAIIKGKSQKNLNVVRKIIKDLENQEISIKECSDFFNLLQTDLLKVQKASDRINKIIEGMRSLSIQHDNTPMEEFSLKKVIEETLSLCFERLNNENIRIDINVHDKMAFVACRPAQLIQVLLNLIINSMDAIKDLDEKWIQIDLSSSATHFLLRVTDSGLGIKESLINKIMQPFFTTKPTGQGTGLGLSISREILLKHGGDLIYERFDGNTSFLMKIKKDLLAGSLKPEILKKNN